MARGMWRWMAGACGVAFMAGCMPRSAEPVKLGGPSVESRRSMSSSKVVVFGSEQRRLHSYAMSLRDGSLSRTSTVTLPEQVHYAAADAGSRYLYVSASDGSTHHWLYAYAIDP